MSSTHKPSVAVLISGTGSNLQALIDHAKGSDAPYVISAVISNNPDAGGIAKARNANIPVSVIDHTEFINREAFDHALQMRLDQINPDLIVLAGFMRVLSAATVNHFMGRMINIHPSLLPKYRGLNTHRRALAERETEHGVSVHFVTQELDGGPVIAQSKTTILRNDDENSLSGRIQGLEHILYPQVVEWFTRGKLRLNNRAVEFNGNQLDTPIILDI